MSMIAGGDQSARNAFLTTLRDDSSRRVVDASSNRTQELDPGDILEVKDLANAIERAERSMLTPLPVPAQYSRSLDMFDALGAPDAADSAPESATDDISGPALHAPVIPTPVPPAAVAAPKVTIPPAPPVLYVATDEDAFLQAGPRIRTLADESLQIQRDPTLLVRAQVRRRKATTIASIVFGLGALFIGGAFAASQLSARADAATAQPAAVATTTIATATLPKPTPPQAAETKPADAKPASAKPAEAKPASAKPAEAKPASAKPADAKPADAKPTEAKSSVPTFDVKSLPAAKAR